jgi:hypothetical protein
VNESIHLSLISHTNVGKTTLARTLLRREVGEVFDQSHVTDLAEEFTLIETETAALKLWDTPGFGDSFRLWRRLQKADTAVLGFLNNVWDRFADRPFWCCQQAILNVRHHADVVLYLANAAEDPSEAAYVKPELEILAWLKKPIVVLLNQLGPPRGKEAEQADLDRWREHFSQLGVSCQVMAFDAFARCWVQENVLWSTVRSTLAENRQPAMDSCLEQWRRRDVDIFRRSLGRMAAALAELIRDKEELPPQSLAEKIFSPVMDSLKVPQKDAMTRLGERMMEQLAEAVTDVIRIHELSGESARQIEERFEDDFAVRQPANQGVAGTISGFLAGALTGLAADFTAGGLTFGGGAVIGGILGATGGVLAAQSYNFISGRNEAHVSWSPQFLRGVAESLILRYLAVAHFGRGRGEWRDAEHPKHWVDEVKSVLASFEKLLEFEFREIRKSGPGEAAELPRILSDAAAACLQRLYPDAVPSELLGWQREVVEISASRDAAPGQSPPAS